MTPPVVQRGDDRREVAGGGERVVAGVRGVRPAVAAQVDGDHPMAGGGQYLGDAVPGPGVGRQPVHQQEGRLAACPLPHVQPDTVADRNHEIAHGCDPKCRRRFPPC
jgi:hypothetical protein